MLRTIHERHEKYQPQIGRLLPLRPSRFLLEPPGRLSLAEHKFAWSEFEQPIRLARRAKTKDGFRSENISPSGARTRFK
ncbi:hypothetical protein [Candidatus Methylobacter oryzae]|uniref:Uncharacterized protein n=1 Tax=Candidatus Methylobacter oryzae TaxID=2497749 RepID=A0ABY3CDY1_9GAMM|nr:hypothetical protein [Candidatus Methylobacter oryzae]TRX01015.1 hypothetical protein EKO24_004400 [Candidatus Methylobacter oryzae]